MGVQCVCCWCGTGCFHLPIEADWAGPEAAIDVVDAVPGCEAAAPGVVEQRLRRGSRARQRGAAYRVVPSMHPN
jgi:hypothetical protein